jgi:hypothetical protein
MNDLREVAEELLRLYDGAMSEPLDDLWTDAECEVWKNQWQRLREALRADPAQTDQAKE